MSKLIYDPFWFIGMCFVYSFAWYFIDKRLLNRLSKQDKHNYNLATEKAKDELGAWDAELEEKASNSLFMLILKKPLSQWSLLHYFFVAHRLAAAIIAILIIIIFFTVTT